MTNKIISIWEYLEIDEHMCSTLLISFFIFKSYLPGKADITGVSLGKGVIVRLFSASITCEVVLTYEALKKYPLIEGSTVSNRFYNFFQNRTPRLEKINRLDCTLFCIFLNFILNLISKCAGHPQVLINLFIHGFIIIFTRKLWIIILLRF